MYSWKDGSLPADMLAVAVGTSSGSLVSSSENRYALIVGPSNAGRVTFAPFATVSLDQGFTIQPQADPVVMTYEQYGEVVRRPWSIIGAVAGFVGVVEVLFD